MESNDVIPYFGALPVFQNKYKIDKLKTMYLSIDYFAGKLKGWPKIWDHFLFWDRRMLKVRASRNMPMYNFN